VFKNIEPRINEARRSEFKISLCSFDLFTGKLNCLFSVDKDGEYPIFNIGEFWFSVDNTISFIGEQSGIGYEYNVNLDGGNLHLVKDGRVVENGSEFE
jgi:hypothetical protein